MMKTVPEPNAELLSAEDVHEDVESLGALLEQRRTEQQAYEILNRPNIREMLKQLVARGICRSEEEAIERALKTLLTAVTP
ncbi:MAG: hypothetical protein H8D67_24665 [Deltaproteobacteria bacterium]|nr:hypothetical protein [Deltaproteobacteria bacterium]